MNPPRLWLFFATQGQRPPRNRNQCRPSGWNMPRFTPIWQEKQGSWNDISRWHSPCV